MNRRPLLEVAQECVFVVTGEQCDRFDECLAKLAEHGIGGTDPSLLVRLTAIAESLGVATVVPVYFNSQEPTDPPLAVKQNKRKHPMSSAGSKHVLEQYGWKSGVDPTVEKRGKGDYPIQYPCVICKRKTNWYCTSEGCRLKRNQRVPSVCSVRTRGCLIAHEEAAEELEEEEEGGASKHRRHSAAV
mmetsp:Transcript_4056/g.7879  ORF Transcript_4056/g.7879 Transcript_4056/m.7879 type:complete len:187 (-) Transcript_4056:26-586(-)